MALVGFSAGGMISGAAAAKQGSPNILFFIADDVDAHLLNYNPKSDGKNLTPNIDRLAKEGTVFSRQQIPSSVCTPSRFSCLTGLYANRSKAGLNTPLCKEAGMSLVSWSAMMDEHTPTLPKMLQKAGYLTGMSGKCHFAWFNGLQRPKGNLSVEDPKVQAILDQNYDLCIRQVQKFGFDQVRSFYVYGQVHDHPVKALRQHNMDWIAAGGLNFIDAAAESDKPFYLYFSTTLPHVPHEDEHSWNADPRVTPRGMLDKPCNVLPDRSTIPERLKAAGIPFTSRRAMMVAVDDALGALIDKLEQTGQLDNTIIFFFNDNGQEGKGTVYEGGITSPSVIWKKGGFKVGRETDALVSNIDFAPTIADWAGADYGSDTFDGTSLVPLLDGKVSKVRDSSYAEMGFTRAVRKGDWKYIAYRMPSNVRDISTLWYKVPGDSTYGERPTFGHMAIRANNPSNAKDLYGMRVNAEKRWACYWDADQLYYLPDDPDEQNNLAGDPAYAKKLAEMKKELVKHIADIPGEFGEFKAR